MLLELHCHTAEHSACSHVAAVELVKRVYEMNLHGIVITDHHYLWPDGELDALRRSAGLPPSFVVLSGQETTTPDAGDVLVYGAGATVPPRTPLASIRAANPAAALILAHPFRDGKRPSREKLLNPLIDGVEIFNSNHSVSDNVRGLGDWHRYKFTAIAGTDTHGISYAGTYLTQVNSSSWRRNG